MCSVTYELYIPSYNTYSWINFVLEEDLSDKYTTYRDGCLKRFKDDRLFYGDSWHFLKKDFEHKKKGNEKLYTKKSHTTVSADKETVENEKIPPGRRRGSTSTLHRSSETNFDADGPELFKRRKRDVDHENQRYASYHMPKTTDGSEDIQYVDNNEKYDDRLNRSETNLEKSLKKISTKNRGKKNISTLCF